MELTRALVARGVLTPAVGWEAAAAQRFQAHIESLDEAYFVKGQYRMERVQRWARGMAESEDPLQE